MIIQNAIKILKDDFYLISAHLHHFNCHLLENGEKICVDGGNGSYLRRVGCLDKKGILWKEWSLSDESKFSDIKKQLLWGTRSKSGRDELKYLPLAKLETAHLKAILKTQRPGKLYVKVIKSILKDRGKKNG